MISLPTIIAIVFSLFFGVLAAFFSFRDERTRRLLKKKEKAERQYLFESSVLNGIQSNTGYSLDCEKVANIICDNLEKMMPYSTVSAMILKKNNAKFEVNLNESVSGTFIKNIKNIMQNSLTALSGWTIQNINDEKTRGKDPDDKAPSVPLSFFNVPLVINNKIEGLINIASSHHDFYKEDEMTELYKIIDHAAGAVAAVQDIILKEDGKLAALMASLESSVVIVDREKKIMMINQPARDLLGIKTDDPSLNDVLSTLPSSYNFVDKIDKAISLNQKIEEKSIRFQDKTIDITIVPVASNSEDNAKVIGASIFIHDATPQKSLAKMKEDFTNIIVHELRSPLTSIKASSEMLNSANSLTEDEKKRLIGIVYDQTCKMLDEVSMILDAAKLDSGLFTVHKVPGDLKKTISDSAEAFRKQAENKFINLVTNIDPFIPQASFDAREIRRAITNLLTNSLKFTPGGGTISVRAWTAGDKVYVSVSDTGSGIPPEKQPLLFAKFAQVQSPGSKVGTGLGLYITKGIVDAHSGTIGVQSDSGKGTNITFSIPTNLPAQTAGITPVPPQKPFSPLAN